MRIKIRNKTFEVKKVSGIGKAIGLMFSRREKADSLLFEFKKPTTMKIHSCFVFFPFLAIWLDKEDKILALKEIKPFQFNVGIRKPYCKLVEIPVNLKNSGIIKLLCP